MRLFKFVGAVLAMGNLFAAIAVAKGGDYSGALILLSVSAWITSTLFQLD